MSQQLKTDNPKDIAVVLVDKDLYASLPSTRCVHFFSPEEKREINHFRHIFVVSTGLGLPDIAPFVRQANSQKRLRGLLVRQESFPFWITQLLDIADLRCLNNLLVYSDRDTAKRVLTAWTYGAQNALIADAAVLGDKLLVRDCALTRYELVFHDLRDLNHIKLQDRAQFVISPDGSYLAWPAYDIHIGLETIKSALAPQDSKKESAEYDRTVGVAIAKFRVKKNLRQADVLGLSERHLRKIETGKQRATTKSLKLLARSHGVSLNNYLNKIAGYMHKAD